MKPHTTVLAAILGLSVSDGRETLGEWKSGKPWNAVTFDLSGKPITSYKNGAQQPSVDLIKQAKLIKFVYTLDSQGQKPTPEILAGFYQAL